MKITEAYEYRKEIIDIINATSFANLIGSTILTDATTQVEFENILLANFSWLVLFGILEEWLPDELPNCIKLDCTGCRNLTKLPKLPKCKILYCYNCDNIKEMPKLPKCRILIK